MKVKLQELEFGSQQLDSGKNFYQELLGLELSVDQEQLKVFKPGLKEIDFNISTHLPAASVVISFLCDDLKEMMQRLQLRGISFEGPFASHLGMETISLRDPNGHLVRINQSTEASPEWLRMQKW